MCIAALKTKGSGGLTLSTSPTKVLLRVRIGLKSQKSLYTPASWQPNSPSFLESLFVNKSH